MKRSTERFLTTHTGSLPRPEDLIRMMYAKEEGVPIDRAALAARVRAAVAEVVRKQADAGVDIVNDGELSKPSYATYVKDRLNGFGGTGNTFVYQDLAEFPNLAKRVFGDPGRSRRKTPACNAPISVRDAQAARDDVDNLKAALGAVHGGRGVHERSVARRGVAVLPQRPLQGPREPICSRSPTPCGTSTRPWPGPASCCRSTAPTSAWAATSSMRTSSLAEFRKRATMHVEAINHALAGIPPDQLRIHLCWGNYEGPHHYDVPLADVIDIVFRARPNAISLEAANPRHAHEWALFERVKLPDGKLLIPGVIESKSNFIEHPELIAQRIGALRQTGRARERHRRQRLRLRHLGRAGGGGSGRGLGQAQGAGRRRAYRVSGSSGLGRVERRPLGARRRDHRMKARNVLRPPRERSARRAAPSAGRAQRVGTTLIVAELHE